MQKQFSSLIKEKSLSNVESYIKDSESFTNQLTLLGNIINCGDYTIAFEKVNYFLLNCSMINCIKV